MEARHLRSVIKIGRWRTTVSRVMMRKPMRIIRLAIVKNKEARGFLYYKAS